MIFTQRQQADLTFDKIKSSLKESNLDFFLQESPFSANIFLKKKFLKDFSANSLNLPSSASDVNFPTLVPIVKDDETYNSLKTAQNTLEIQEKTIVDLNKEINRLKETNTNKDNTITMIQSALTKSEEERNRLKKDKETKTEQLKHKNKVLDTTKTNLEKMTAEHEKVKTSYQNKVKNMEKKIENLGSQIEEKREELKFEKRKDRNDMKKSKKESEKTKNEIESLKKALEKANDFNDELKLRLLSTEEVTISPEESTKTSTKSENKSVGTSTLFTKVHLLGEPNHDISCFCLCHDASSLPHKSLDDYPDGRCQVQVFQYTTDPDVALDSIYYRDILDFTGSTDSEEETEDEDDGKGSDQGDAGVGKGSDQGDAGNTIHEKT